MKKVIALALSAALTLGLLASCGSPSQPSNPTGSTPSSNSSAPGTSAPPAAADWKPDRSIKALIGYGAGGSTDSAIRPLLSIAEGLAGQTIVVENTAGGSASISFNSGVTAAADGYTLIIGAETPALYDAYDLIDYTYDDVTVIMVVADADNSIFVAADSPYQTVQDLFDAEKANPGSVLKVASGNVGVNATLSAVYKYTQGVDFNSYTADGSSSAVVTVMGGFADFGQGSLATLKDYWANGDVRILCSNTVEPIHPDIPTITETYPEMADYLPLSAFYTICIQGDADQAVVDYYTDLFTQAYNSKEYQDALVNMGLNPVGLTGSAAREYVDTWRKNALTVLTGTGAVEHTMEELGF